MDLEPIDENNILEESAKFNNEGEFYELLLNNFMIHHNEINEVSDNMFNGIDQSDITSTNYHMESFYQLMMDYHTNKKDHPNKIKLYTKSEEDKLKNTDDLFVLKVNNQNMFYSQNKFSLLLKVTEDKIKDWKIYTLR